MPDYSRLCNVGPMRSFALRISGPCLVAHEFSVAKHMALTVPPLSSLLWLTPICYAACVDRLGEMPPGAQQSAGCRDLCQGGGIFVSAQQRRVPGAGQRVRADAVGHGRGELNALVRSAWFGNRRCTC
jgi:hypothetical protein